MKRLALILTLALTLNGCDLFHPKLDGMDQFLADLVVLNGRIAELTTVLESLNVSMDNVCYKLSTLQSRINTLTDSINDGMIEMSEIGQNLYCIRVELELMQVDIDTIANPPEEVLMMLDDLIRTLEGLEAIANG